MRHAGHNFRTVRNQRIIRIVPAGWTWLVITLEFFFSGVDSWT